MVKSVLKVEQVRKLHYSNAGQRDVFEPRKTISSFPDHACELMHSFGQMCKNKKGLKHS